MVLLNRCDRLLRVLIFVLASAALTGALTTDAAAAKFKVLHSFCGHGDGCNPQSPVIIDSSGNLFGTAPTLGSQQDGVAYEMSPKAKGFRFSLLFQFAGGPHPTGPLIIDTQGNLYGTANPDRGSGLVFELSPNGDKRRRTEKILYRFCSQQNCTDGMGPAGGLTYAGASSGAPYDGVSPLYGVTGGGGANNGGTVFQLTNSNGNWTEAVPYSFCAQGADKCTDGKLPLSGLLVGSGGNLFGTAYEGGGTEQAGTAFQLSPSGQSWNYTLLYTFCSATHCSDGAGPEGPLVFDADGALLGTTRSGGANCRRAKTGCGTIFKIIPNGSQSQETVLHSFCQQRDCRDGAGPIGGVAIDTQGSLYGATAVGGGNDIDQHGAGGGTVFRLTANDLKILHSFCSMPACADGELPQAGVVLDQGGNVYGTTEYGGANSNDTLGGTLFRVTPR